MQNKVRELREASGWSQERVAQTLGVHRNTVSAWECGGEIKSSNLMQLIALFDVDVNTVLGLPGDDERVPSPAPAALPA